MKAHKSTRECLCLSLSLFFFLFLFFCTTSAGFIESGIYASTDRICPCEYEESSGPNDVFSHTSGTLLTLVLPSGGSLLCVLDEKTQLRQFLEIFSSVQGKMPQKPNPKQSPKLSIWNRCLQSYKQNKIAFCRPRVSPLLKCLAPTWKPSKQANKNLTTNQKKWGGGKEGECWQMN